MTSSSSFVESFAKEVGQIAVLTPYGDTKTMYDLERSIMWNREGANTNPACIVQPRCLEDACAIFKAYAKLGGGANTKSDTNNEAPKLAVACGRHSLRGFHTDALVVDLSKWKKVSVDADAQTVTVWGGVKLGDMDEELSKHSLGCVTGTNPDTGVIGLSLHGGFGYMSRKYGMAVDNFVSATIVLADGSVVQASETEHSDLFYAIRGGGGGFGLVASLTMKCHPLKNAAVVLHPTVCLRPYKQTATMIEEFFKFSASSPDECFSFMVVPCKVPVNVVVAASVDTVSIPQQSLSKPVMSLKEVNAKKDQKVSWEKIPGLRELKHNKLGGSFRIGGSSLKITDYHKGLQTLLVKQQGSGHYYQSSTLIREMTPEIAKVIAAATKSDAPNSLTTILLFGLGGQITNASDTDMAFNGHNDEVWVIVEGRWKYSKNKATYDERKQKVRDWVHKLRDDLAAAGGKPTAHFLNEKSKSAQQLGAYDADKVTKLKATKNTYDPHNVFYYNPNF